MNTPDDASKEPTPARKRRIPTWLGLLSILGAILVAGLVGLLLERLTAAPHP